MRTLCGLLLIVALGCGGSATPTPEPKAPPPEPTPAPPPPEPKKDEPKKDEPKKDEPKKDEPKTPPPPPAAAWEPDPAKHAVPTAPAAGTLAKAAFAPPEVEFQADTLTFRTVDKDHNPLVTLSVKLLPEQATAAAGGLKLVVKPDDPKGKVPTVTVEVPAEKKGELKAFVFENYYALTLDLGKREKGSLAGRVYLSLPNDDKDFLAGTFTADWVRPTSEPPGADDTPFVHGAVRVVGAKADTDVSVGYIGLPKGTDLPTDTLTMRYAGAGDLSGRSDQVKPRVTLYVAAQATDKAGRYEHTRLPAGKYLVFAASAGFPPQAKWLTLPADGKQALDFALDPAAAGKLDVKVPAGVTGKVFAVPADDAPVPPEVFGFAASALGLGVDVPTGTARFGALAPGRYEVRLGDMTGTVEVRRNETATLELAPPKK